LPARPFWVIFTICIIILIEWLVVMPITELRMADDIEAMKLPYNEVFAPEPPVSPDRVVTKHDLKPKSFKFMWEALYTNDPAKALSTTIALFVMGVLAGFLIASVAFRHLVRFGDKLGQLSTTDKIAIFMGLLIGLMLSAILLPGIMSLLRLPRNPVAISVAGVVIMYLCVMAMLSIKEELKVYFPGLSKSGELDKAFQKPKLLDTNVIIDGRIADVCRAGFVEGRIVVSSFVLEELQHIADSSDSLKRARGRRGLDILNQMRKELELTVRQSDPVDPANSEEVDIRLVKLAQEVDGAIVTNDFNLNKVAELHGVPVLNINELANALKPVVLPGEEMTVSIIKEGKESNQGVAYLDDGTMVVVEGAKRHIGDTLDVIVTSVLQTIAGKMIFANLKTIQDEQDKLIDRNVRNYSSFRPRKKAR